MLTTHATGSNVEALREREEEQQLLGQRRLLDELALHYIDSGAVLPFKRAPSMGFHGMRGKKDDHEDEQLLLLPNEISSGVMVFVKHLYILDEFNPKMNVYL